MSRGNRLSNAQNKQNLQPYKASRVGGDNGHILRIIDMSRSHDFAMHACIRIRARCSCNFFGRAHRKQIMRSSWKQKLVYPIGIWTWLTNKISCDRQKRRVQLFLWQVELSTLLYVSKWIRRWDTISCLFPKLQHKHRCAKLIFCLL